MVFRGRARYICVTVPGYGQKQLKLPENECQIVREDDGSLTVTAQGLLIAFAPGQWSMYETWTSEP